MAHKPRFPGVRVTANGNQLVSYHTESRIADAGIFYPITPSTEGKTRRSSCPSKTCSSASPSKTLSIAGTYDGAPLLCAGSRRQHQGPGVKR